MLETVHFIFEFFGEIAEAGLFTIRMISSNLTRRNGILEFTIWKPEDLKNLIQELPSELKRMQPKSELQELYDQLLNDLGTTAVRLHDYLVDLHGSNGLAEDLIEVLRLFGVQNLDPVRFTSQLKKLTESESKERAKPGDQSKDAVDKRKEKEESIRGRGKSQEKSLEKSKEKTKEKSPEEIKEKDKEMSREKSKDKSQVKPRDTVESKLSDEKSQLLPNLSKSTEKEKSELFRRVIESLIHDDSVLSTIFNGLKSKSKSYVERSQLEFNLRNLDGEHFNPTSRRDGGRTGEGSRDAKGIDQAANDFYSRLLRHLDDRLHLSSRPASRSTPVARTASNLRSTELFERNAISKLETILELKELKLQDDEEAKQRNEQTNRFVLALRNESGMFCLLNSLLFAFMFYLLIKQPVDA